MQMSMNFPKLQGVILKFIKANILYPSFQYNVLSPDGPQATFYDFIDIFLYFKGTWKRSEIQLVDP